MIKKIYLDRDEQDDQLKLWHEILLSRLEAKKTI